VRQIAKHWPVVCATRARTCRDRYRISNRRGRPRGVVVGVFDGPPGTTQMDDTWTGERRRTLVQPGWPATLQFRGLRERNWIRVRSWAQCARRKSFRNLSVLIPDTPHCWNQRHYRSFVNTSSGLLVLRSYAVAIFCCFYGKVSCTMENKLYIAPGRCDTIEILQQIRC